MPRGTFSLVTSLDHWAPYLQLLDDNMKLAGNHPSTPFPSSLWDHHAKASQLWKTSIIGVEAYSSVIAR
ncbi:hypothetical protein VNO78_08261 [Psophocarpus tetragonolobus]|uniref:Uncharacterized protein n=1 Tax=Psophocarpus tetragonolobus TaxID=3891 RepID=A0AAN9T567_PSOTE